MNIIVEPRTGQAFIAAPVRRCSNCRIDRVGATTGTPTTPQAAEETGHVLEAFHCNHCGHTTLHALPDPSVGVTA